MDELTWPMSGAADLALLGARLEPMVPGHRPATALAVRKGRIVAIGSDAEVDGALGPTTRVVRLAGETVMPGFQDAHVHPVYGGLLAFRCDLHGLPDQDAYLAAVTAYAAAHPEREWIEGDGWTYAPFPGGRPRREALDRVVGHRPVFLTAYDGHTAWVNSRALELAGISADSPDPPHGRIERDPDGTPTGLLAEDAQRLVHRLIPPPSAEELVEALLAAQRHLHALGITAWHDPGVNPEWLPAYRTLAENGRLTARVTAAQQWQPWGRPHEADPLPRLLTARDACHVGRLRADCVKFWLDGVLENGTAVVLEPYLGPDGAPGRDHGMSNYATEELASAVIELERRGFDGHFHAIGDGAVRQALDAVAGARVANGPRDIRHSIAHLELVHPDDIGRFGALEVSANLQPLWATLSDDAREVLVPQLGPQRVDARYPFRSLQRAGARLAGGSDWSVTSANPLEEMEVAIRRVSPRSRDDPPFAPDQRLDLESALAMFTTGAAWVNRLESETGTLEPGKWADLVVLDRDLRAMADRWLADASVRMTLVAGEEVFAA